MTDLQMAETTFASNSTCVSLLFLSYEQIDEEGCRTRRVPEDAEKGACLTTDGDPWPRLENLSRLKAGVLSRAEKMLPLLRNNGVERRKGWCFKPEGAAEKKQSLRTKGGRKRREVVLAIGWEEGFPICGAGWGEARRALLICGAFAH